MDKQKPLQEILQGAEETLWNAELALKELLRGPAERRLPSLRNVVVFGEAANSAVLALAGRHPGFDDWLAQQAGVMDSDPDVVSFRSLGREVLTAGRPNLNITQLRVSSDGRQYGTRPKNVRAFFIGDRNGGSGWEVVLPDETIDKYYVALPEDLPPLSTPFRTGAIHTGPTAEDLSERFLLYVREMVRNAREHFL